MTKVNGKPINMSKPIINVNTPDSVAHIHVPDPTMCLLY